MNNIQEPVGISRHSEATLWINRLMIDLKLRLAGLEPTAPITLARLDEFDAIHRDLLRCQQRDTTSRWNTRSHPKHSDAVDWLNQLIIDLQKSLIRELCNYPRREITLERLAEYRTHRESIEGCMTRAEVVY